MKTAVLEPQRKIYTVSDITRDIRGMLEDNFHSVWVEGEISNFKWHSSGHMYFALKDENAQIQCVMFRVENAKLLFEPAEGMSVLCFGRVSVYPVRGQYQLYIERIEPKGVGALQLKFEAMKEKLAKEGLFDAARKRPVPYLPSRIGIVTSIDGAALQDMLTVLDRRHANARILIAPAQVQGAGAAESVAAAIESLNELRAVDVIIVGRGGGSLEDLWAFNEEVVARAIFNSAIPVISAVGHEVDFTIADFTADLRAATPSAAAELVLPLQAELVARIAELKKGLAVSFTNLLRSWRQELDALRQSRALKDPLAIFEIQFQKLDELKKNLSERLKATVRLEKEKLCSLIGKLEALGPLATLKRGFSVTLRAADEKLVTSAGQLKAGDLVKTKLHKGFFISQVKETNA